MDNRVSVSDNSIEILSENFFYLADLLESATGSVAFDHLVVGITRFKHANTKMRIL